MHGAAPEQLLDFWVDTLHQHGYRVTTPRRVVMAIIAASPVALSPKDIYEQTLDEEQEVGIASVYRTVEMLEELGLVQQVHQPDGCHGVWPVYKGHNHYLICQECGRMEVIPGDEDIDSYIHKVEAQTGYRIQEHWLQFFGLCSQCAH